MKNNPKQLSLFEIDEVVLKEKQLNNVVSFCSFKEAKTIAGEKNKLVEIYHRILLNAKSN
ncbi:hypothetical protein [Chromobacterium sphagni]|uniref:hypothetical protein n=1 Tax=Chromobacterium sphagni TaxID=1903179 RepID=UPI001113E124|nr:hypothetical protein [Chromobacterium sphagni]